MPSVCFTGRGVRLSGEHYLRTQWETIARQFNHVVYSDVEPGMTYLVAANGVCRTRKGTRARDFGVQIISYEQYERLVFAGQTPRTLASDMAAVARAGTGRSSPETVDISYKTWSDYGRSPARQMFHVQSGSLGLGQYATADAAYCVAENHARERQSLGKTVTIAMTPLAIGAAQAQGFIVPNGDVVLPTPPAPPAPPAPKAHPLGGVRRIINLDGD